MFKFKSVNFVNFSNPYSINLHPYSLISFIFVINNKNKNKYIYFFINLLGTNKCNKNKLNMQYY